MATKTKKTSDRRRTKPRSSPSPCSALAWRIAGAILTVYDSDGGTECTRAQMMLRQSDGSERNMGGRDKQSIADEIERLLREHAYENE